MAIIQHANLFFQEGNSNKEYHLQLIKYENLYSVTFQYGRRGSALNDGTKIAGVTLEAAQKVYNKVLNEKLGKGYQEASSGVNTQYTGPVYVPAPSTRRIQTEAPSRPTAFSPVPRRVVDWDDEVTPAPVAPASDIIFIPQLLNVIDEVNIETYINDDRFGMQEKIDGQHQPFHKKAGEVLVTNKKGKAIGYPVSLTRAIQTEKDVLVDAEVIGDKFYAFDLLEIHGDNLRGKGYEERYEALKTLFSLGTFDTQQILLVPMAVGYRAKRILYNRLKAEGREGVVFKLLDAPYTPGKAHSAM